VTDNEPAVEPVEKPKQPRKAPLYIVGALCLVSLVAATWFSVAWLVAKFSNPSSDVREDLMTDAGQAAIALNSFDTNDLEATFSKIEESITGEALTAEMAEARKSMESQPPSGGTMTAELTDSAISSLDLDSDKADVIAVLVRTTTGTSGETLKDRVMMLMHLTQVDGKWKVEEVTSYGLAQTIYSSLLDGPPAPPAEGAPPVEAAPPAEGAPPAEDVPAPPAEAPSGN
jgi:Mce-associated membrane protein